METTNLKFDTYEIDIKKTYLEKMNNDKAIRIADDMKNNKDNIISLLKKSRMGDMFEFVTNNYIVFCILIDDQSTYEDYPAKFRILFNGRLTPCCLPLTIDNAHLFIKGKYLDEELENKIVNAYKEYAKDKEVKLTSGQYKVAAYLGNIFSHNLLTEYDEGISMQDMESCIELMKIQSELKDDFKTVWFTKF